MKRKINFEILIYKILGTFLLTPPILSVVIFIFQLVFSGSLSLSLWTGWAYYDERSAAGFGITTTLPIYFGLMAIAGVVLITKKADN